MSADDVRIAEALEDIASHLSTIAEAMKDRLPELSHLENISNRLSGFTGFLEDFAKHNFD
jgi:hypothetical protein